MQSRDAGSRMEFTSPAYVLFNASLVRICCFEGCCQVVQNVFHFLGFKCRCIDIIVASNCGPQPKLINSPVDRRGDDSLVYEFLKVRCSLSRRNRIRVVLPAIRAAMLAPAAWARRASS